MLIGLDPLLTPDLLHALAAMGHGDRIALVDANYPARRGRRLIDVPGAGIEAVLGAVLTLLPLDSFVPDPAVVMQRADGAGGLPRACAAIDAVLQRHGAEPSQAIERHAFYAAAEQAYAVVLTGERRFYGNVILTKGVVPPEAPSMNRPTIHGPLGMGGAPLGNHQQVIPDDVALATVAAAWDAGIRRYDTAPHYGAGLSEHRMGDVLRRFPREAFTLSSKVGRMLEPAAAVPEVAEQFHHALSFRRRVDFTHDGALRSIEDSLQRLGLSRIDVVYIHDCAPDWLGEAWREQFDIAMGGAARALARLQDEGVIAGWGFGVNVVDPCILALQQAEPSVFLVAGRYTLLDHTALAELLPLCERRGARVVLGGPYNSGLLAGGDTFNYERAPAALVERTRRIAAVCGRHGVDLKAAALQFCAAHPAVAAVIPGARTPAEVVQNAAMMTQPIPADLWAELRAEQLLPEQAPTPA